MLSQKPRNCETDQRDKKGLSIDFGINREVLRKGSNNLANYCYIFGLQIKTAGC